MYGNDKEVPPNLTLTTQNDSQMENRGHRQNITPINQTTGDHQNLQGQFMITHQKSAYVAPQNGNSKPFNCGKSR